jgi:hypothetical protein
LREFSEGGSSLRRAFLNQDLWCFPFYVAIKLLNRVSKQENYLKNCLGN